MRVKLIKPYKNHPAGAVADFRNAQTLINQGIAVWVAQDTACKKENAELYGKCTHPIDPALLQAKTASKPVEIIEINETEQEETETEPQKRTANFFKSKLL
jgi:hypothetical protein